MTLGVTLSRCVCVRRAAYTYRLHAALVSAAKVMCCIQCCLVPFVCLFVSTTINRDRGFLPPNATVELISLTYRSTAQMIMQMQNDFKSEPQTPLILSSWTYIYQTRSNPNSNSIRHCKVPRLQGDAAIHRYFGQETLVTVVATL